MKSWAWALAALAAVGCGRHAPTTPAGTGAEAVARDYCGAVVRQDWDAAYAALDPDGRAAVGPASFRRAAATYRRGFGFEPEEGRVRSCEEHGDEAVAHVVFTGPAGAAHRSYQDGLTLRRTPAGWGVVLPPALRPHR